MRNVNIKSILVFIGYIIFLVLLIGAVGFFYKFTNGFQEQLKTFYLEFDGYKILAQNSWLTLQTGEKYHFDAKYLFSEEDATPVGIDVKIVPNVECDFTFTVDGDEMSYASLEDLSPAFNLSVEKDSFEFELVKDFDIKYVLSECFPEKVVSVEDGSISSDDYPYIIAVSSPQSDIVYNILLSVSYGTASVELDKGEIIFSLTADERG